MEQLKERPEALEALRQMLNHSSFFLKSIQNLSALEMEDDPIFTKVEVETLEKLVNDTQVSGAVKGQGQGHRNQKMLIPLIQSI